ncbi:hypothetical protein CONLIGDRAFT_687566 [Coniochaeta ligniaria NRRL 30616]|uniref:Uncharacterized protein n=1 Tax=Coniochaeta ligniaria NRRL 30616 TaxID=1408157 RepID=A0A1J7J4P1_9PEZI|nr:hypothetical protein CONLIGDRAFT_687566 [Coniochaeta ligniaria NRRL 30616]
MASNRDHVDTSGCDKDSDFVWSNDALRSVSGDWNWHTDGSRGKGLRAEAVAMPWQLRQLGLRCHPHGFVDITLGCAGRAAVLVSAAFNTCLLLYIRLGIALWFNAHMPPVP